MCEPRPPRLSLRAGIIAGTHSGCGKTTISLGLMAALTRAGFVVQPYKAGPDFIDPGHHASATGRPCINLDGWMCGPDGVREAFARGLTHPGQPGALPAFTFRHAAAQAAFAAGRPATVQRAPDVALVEGVMGLHDGACATSPLGSTAELAMLLDLPVILVVRARGMARSVAAVVNGYAHLEPGLRMAGVICNEVGGEGHREMLREALAHHCPGIPLLGMLPRDATLATPSRHLGLVLAGERDEKTFLEHLATMVTRHMDLDVLLEALAMPLAHGAVRHTGTAADLAPAPACPAGGEHPGGDAAPSMRHPAATAPCTHACAGRTPLATGTACDEPPTRHDAAPPPAHVATGTVRRPQGVPPADHLPRVRVAIARDAAFCFLYAENLALLHEAGVDPLFFSPLDDTEVPPDAQGVLLPGGYPELHATRLAENISMRESLRAFAASGRPVVGECGGYMYLMEELETPSGVFPMSGCLPLRCRMDTRLRALGYREASSLAATPYGPGGTVLRGHEYHYSHVVEAPVPASGTSPVWALRDRRGRDLGTEGCRMGSVTGSYIHLHLASNRAAAHAFAAACNRHGTP